MNYIVEVLESTELDIERTFFWYESEKDNLGLELLDLIDAKLVMLQKNPEIGFEVKRPFRRIVLNRFPYILYYVFENSIVTIIAFLHAHRAPARVDELLLERLAKK